MAGAMMESLSLVEKDAEGVGGVSEKGTEEVNGVVEGHPGEVEDVEEAVEASIGVQRAQTDVSEARSQRLQRPLPESQAATDHGSRYSIAQRVQALTLLSLGFSPKQVEQAIRIPARTCRRILEKAQQRGYRPREDPRILDYYVEDGHRSGRPRKDEQHCERTSPSNVPAETSGNE